MTLSTEELYAKAMKLAIDDPDNFWELGRVLRRLLDRDTDLYQKLLDKTGLGSRKAYYLIEISRTFEPLKVSRARLEKLRWTKLQLIAGHVTQDNVEEMLDLAESLSSKQLERVMKGGTAIKNAACVLMYFSPSEYKELEEALKQYGGLPTRRGIQNREEALLQLIRAMKTQPKGL